MSSIDLRLINENFNRLFEGVDMSSQPLPEEEQLKKSLEEALVDCGDYASDYTKENALVGAIKTHYPDQEWWEVCKVDIPTCVYTIHNPEELVATITEGICGKKEEESLEEGLLDTIAGWALRKGAKKLNKKIDGKTGLANTALNSVNSVVNNVSSDVSGLLNKAGVPIGTLLNGNDATSSQAAEIIAWIQQDRRGDKEFDKYFGDRDPSSITMQEITTWMKNSPNGVQRRFKRDMPQYSALVEEVESTEEVELEEAISPEDQKDSDTIRDIMYKSEVRANAKLTPEEKETMNKLGLRRDFGKLYATDSDGQGMYALSKSHDWGRNGAHGKINYADRARKLADRAKLNYGINTSTINKHGTYDSSNAYNRVEATVMDDQMSRNRRNLKMAMSDRNWHKRVMDNADDKYKSSIDAAKKAYDAAIERAEKDKADATTGYHKKGYDSANDTIDRILRREPKVEESLNESTYRGVPGTKFISHGHSADPEISVKHDDKTYVANYWDVEDSMYTYYKEDKEYAKSHDDKYAKNLKDRYTFDDSDEDFNKFLKDHADSVIDDIISMGKVEESLEEDIKIYRESDLTDFEFWSGAKDTVKYLTDADLRQISSILEDSYPEGITETEVNDIFWFEDDWIAEMLGYENFEELMEARESDEE